MRMREPFFFFSFLFLFVSFLPFFRLFLSSFRSPFLLWRGDWNGRAEEFFLFFFSFYFLFLGKQRGSNWKNSKEVLPIFLLNFLYFFFLFSLLIFSFWERKWESGRIKMCAPNTLNEICKNIVVFKIAFLGKKIRQKFIFYAKIRLKMPKIRKFSPKIFLAKPIWNFWRNFWQNQEVILCDQKISKAANASRWSCQKAMKSSEHSITSKLRMHRYSLRDVCRNL